MVSLVCISDWSRGLHDLYHPDYCFSLGLYRIWSFWPCYLPRCLVDTILFFHKVTSSKIFILIPHLKLKYVFHPRLHPYNISSFLIFYFPGHDLIYLFIHYHACPWDGVFFFLYIAVYIRIMPDRVQTCNEHLLNWCLQRRLQISF